MLNNRPANLYNPEEAEAKAQMLQELDPDWTYEAVHDPKGTGLSFIEVHDEDGELVGKL
tara:strand:+ start:602 stop:778 length:177 start_codon:yes stop_codon:yes gene_type:complete